MIEAYNKYRKAGFACLPTKEDKSPLIGKNWKDGFSEEYFTEAKGIGIICGSLSDGLECLDFDNHFSDAKENLKAFLDIPEVAEIYQQYKLPIESTKNGGYHLLFRCEKNEGNRKLAQRLNDEQRPDAIIETRGQGGYFCAWPTPGYKVIRNDILNVAKISVLERAVLIDNAISTNQFYPLSKSEYERQDRPGDLYNASIEASHEIPSLLRSEGWTESSPGRWIRPGKKTGLSATLGIVAPNWLYVFSANAYPFYPMKAYSPFQVLALLKFKGNFSKAAESLPKPEKTIVVSKSKLQETELDKILKEAAINLNQAVKRPPTILTITEQNATSTIYKRVFTQGNFSCIVGKAKSKKTFLISMLTAALLKEKNIDEKFSGEMPIDKKMVLYFDTEQGDYDAYNCIKRIERMAGSVQNLKAFALRQYSPKERCQLIEYAFKIYGDKVGYCVIDGIADLAVAINDEEEASRITTLLLRLTKTYNCHITTVLHQNKNDNYATGWLGSSIMKKAEILISVTKNEQDNSYSEVECNMSRGIVFNKFDFYIDDNGLPIVKTKKDPKLNTVNDNPYWDDNDLNRQEEAPF